VGSDKGPLARNEKPMRGVWLLVVFDCCKEHEEVTGYKQLLPVSVFPSRTSKDGVDSPIGDRKYTESAVRIGWLRYRSPKFKCHQHDSSIEW